MFRRPAHITAILALIAAIALSAWAPGRAAAADVPGQGPGGPVLVVVSPSDPAGRYYAEILRSEGLDEFDVTTTDQLNAAILGGHQVVVVAPTTLTDAQTATLDQYVTGGGDLIAMRPDARLATLLGLGASSGSLSDGYVKIDTSSPPGAGITADTMQFHGTADRWSVTSARTVATLYSDATTSAAAPAVTLRSVGSGQAAAFTYDLARSVIATRQGNIAWAGQKRDGQIDPIRSDDLFFPNWVDFNKIRIPQADEQQRLLANLVTEMSADRLPLPRFWYLPRGLKAAVVMTGDDHGNGGTAGRFDRFKELSTPGCSVADWQCIRSTSYVYPSTPLTDAQVKAYQADGFEIALHLSTDCLNYTPASLQAAWTAQLAQFKAAYPSVAAPRTSRTHCIAWSDWAGEPLAELQNGVRLDTNYYYWPGAWVQNRPGLFTGSGMPMRFANADGTPIDVYQAATQLTDESDIDIATHIAVLLDDALGAQGYYGVFTANMHNDQAAHPGAEAIVAAAQARGVPVVSAAQMLTWLDGRDSSAFQNLSFQDGALHFSIAPDPAARGLQAMVPVDGAGAQLLSLTRDGAPVTTAVRTVKGVDYATFDAAAGSYVARYNPPVPPDTTPPDTTITDAAITKGHVKLTFTSDDPGAHFECRLDGAAFGACTSPVDYTAIAAGTHTFSVRAIDAAGNVDPTPATRTFTLTSAGLAGASGGGAPGPGEGSTPDRTAPRVTVGRRTIRVTSRGIAAVRVTCPRKEVLCRVAVVVRVGKSRLGSGSATINGGRTATIRLHLTAAARRKLARAGSLRVVATVTARDAALNRRATRVRIRLLAPGYRGP